MLTDARGAPRLDAALLDAIICASDDHIYVVDREGAFLYVCSGGADVFGMDRAAMLGRTPDALGLPAYFCDLLAGGAARARAAGGPVRGQTRMPAPSGAGEREFEYAVVPLSGGAAVCTARDVSDRNQARREAADHLAALGAANAALGAANAALAAANAHLADLAATDGLTGLLNFRALQERLSQEFTRAARHGHPLSLLMLDLDHFKAVNDTRGHQAGDDALGALADVLRGAAREADVLGRYGGEEFLVILPQTDSEGARLVAERIRAGVEAADGPLSSVTVSAGVCAMRPDHATHADLLRCVDEALYRSKAAGRNQVAG